MGIILPEKGRAPGQEPGVMVGGWAPDDKRCVRKVVSTGERCKNWARDESTLCSVHGRAPQIKNAVQRRQAATAARRRAIEKYEKEGPLEISGAEDVINVLEERLGVQVQMARALDELVGKLTAANEMRYEHRAGEQLRSEVNVWLQLNQQVTKLGADYLKIGLDERKVRIAEAQAKILVGVIQAVMARLDLTSSQKRIAVQAIPEELHRASIEAGGR